jgi:threonine/homoserine/homoserine lactone efflux protein
MNHSFWMFSFASLILNITPGNDMIYVASRSAGQGVKAGIISALGILAGCFVHILAATAGLSAIIAASATAFDIIKYVGAAYLVYLGIRTLRNKAASFKIKEHMPRLSYAKIFWQGVLTNVLNPLVAVLFGRIGQWLGRNPRWLRWQERITGMVLIALGIKVALTSKK